MHCIAIDQRVNSVWLIMEAGGYYFSTEQVASLAQRQVGFGWLQTDWGLIFVLCNLYDILANIKGSLALMRVKWYASIQ